MRESEAIKLQIKNGKLDRAVRMINQSVSTQTLRAVREALVSGCRECLGGGSFWTEWSDKAEESKEEQGINVLSYPEPPDGTVLIQCKACEGKGVSQELAGPMHDEIIAEVDERIKVLES